jgi:hypothetical protein
MRKNKKTKDAIDSVIRAMMDRIMNNVLVTDPFLVDEHRAKKPLYAALVPDEIFKGSHFERRFVTPFGDAWEKLAIVAAEAGLGFAKKGHTISGNINEERLRRIQEVLNNLEHASGGKHRKKPSWNEELAYILKGKSSSQIPTSVVCDIYTEDVKSGMRYAFEIKAPLPNSDQTKVSKEKILKLYAMSPKKIDKAFYALPYNPYGKKEDYAWTFPARWFDMKNDPVVLIGDEFWEIIGGKGTYQTFIDTVNETGKDYKERIYREYLNIEPPQNSIEEILK